jgi:hypothetical protein
MWTADEETYRKAFLEMLDYYLNLADSTAGNPADFQTLWQPLSSATHTTHIETDIEEATVTRGALVASFAPYQFQTFRLRPRSSAHSQRMQR